MTLPQGPTRDTMEFSAGVVIGVLMGAALSRSILPSGSQGSDDGEDPVEDSAEDRGEAPHTADEAEAEGRGTLLESAARRLKGFSRPWGRS